ncbi:DUF3769 domain-containing protein [Leptolyngbya sp. PCC 6406]|uniref:DUF3769 domain-containing protein n=1 Tax=Leptolyngbya sp. PCC 6406 TaxID=1173264 RepID=UPI0002ACBAB2|nr:DUF3769 domain-containing protein [Leptolyngbya sp. PCC 6406]
MPYPLPPPEPPPIIEIAPDLREEDFLLSFPGHLVPGRTAIAPNTSLQPLPAPSPEFGQTTAPSVARTAPPSPEPEVIDLSSQSGRDRLFPERAEDSAQSLGTSLQVGRGVPPAPRRAPFPLAPSGQAQAIPSQALSQSSPPAAPERQSPEYAIPRVPRGATPEPNWSNGAVTGEGQLLPPTLPTSSPAIPLDLIADSQIFDPEREVVIARGNVRLRVGNGLLYADRLWVNLINRFVLAEGNVVLLRGDQRIEGERLEYNLLQGDGSLYQARGEIFLPTAGEDFANILPGDASVAANRPITQRLRDTGPVRNVTSLGGSSLATGTLITGPLQEEGDIQRFRFEADRIDLDATGWTADEIRLTSDPFSPPELEFRGNSARLVRINENEDELQIENARLVFDQAFTVPLLRSRIRFSRGGVDEEDLNPLPTGIGIDGRDRDGLFVERSFSIATADPWKLTITPQFLIGRFLSNSDLGSLANFGAIADLTGQFGPRTAVTATANLAGLDLENFDNRLRASVRVAQQISSHTLDFEASYRDRLFNGSLGFQDVQSSVGLVLRSPNFVLGDTGINLSYQVGAQYITAITDRPELLALNPLNNFASLGRFQGSLALSRSINLWQGTALPATADQGLRFSPRPLTPYINLNLGTRGTFTYYTNADSQENVSASVGLQGQFGHFAEDFFDYTQWNITYSKSFVGDSTSPFVFDRNVDQNTLSFGIIQQLYGPVRVGFQTAINLDTGAIISTDYLLEYSRRTYGFILQINPERATGFVGFRISAFDWIGRSAAFDGAEVRSVEGGVIY